MCPKNICRQNLKKILIIGGDTVADNLLLAPAVRRVKEVFPHALIDIIAGEASSEFVHGNPLFSGYVLRGGKHKIPGLIKKTREKRYDLIIAFRDFFLPFFLRGKFKLSFFWQDFFSEKVFTHESERVLNFLEPFAGEGKSKTDFYFPVSRKNRESVEEHMKPLAVKNSDTVVIINPGFDSARKRWPHMNYAVVANELVRSYDARIIFTGKQEDKSIIREIMSEVGGNNAYDFSGRFTLREIAALLERADLLIAQDTALMYLASSVRCSAVCIFGPGNPYRYGPLGTKNLAVHGNLGCFPCDPNLRCQNKYLCLEKISTGQVAKSAMLLLDEKEQPLLFDL